MVSFNYQNKVVLVQENSNPSGRKEALDRLVQTSATTISGNVSTSERVKLKNLKNIPADFFKNDLEFHLSMIKTHRTDEIIPL